MAVDEPEPVSQSGLRLENPAEGRDPLNERRPIGISQLVHRVDEVLAAFAGKAVHPQRQQVAVL
jgi:hypothetical protein